MPTAMDKSRRMKARIRPSRLEPAGKVAAADKVVAAAKEARVAVQEAKGVAGLEALVGSAVEASAERRVGGGGGQFGGAAGGAGGGGGGAGGFGGGAGGPGGGRR